MALITRTMLLAGGMLSLFVRCVFTQTPEPSFLVIFPAHITSESEAKLCATVLSPNETLLMSVYLTDGEEKKLLHQETSDKEFHSCFPIQTPSVNKDSVLTMTVEVKGQTSLWTQQRLVKVRQRPGPVTFIQTDKPMYSPGQTHQDTEIAFVLDGSGSIEPSDFDLAKTFISDFVTYVWSKSLSFKFAVVQYGNYVRTELSLPEKDNKDNVLKSIKNILQIGRTTATASAINHVLEHVFTPSNGSDQNAKKYIVLITDGRIFLDPLSLAEVLQNPKITNITRFAIGVGEYVLNDTIAVKDMKEIASDPDEKHFFEVNSYKSLGSTLQSLLSAIFGLEVEIPKMTNDQGTETATSQLDTTALPPTATDEKR